jgi:uncharacterized membrane protein
MRIPLIVVMVLTCATVAFADAHEEAEVDAQTVEEEAEARPVRTPETKVAALFQGRCAACHSGEQPAAGLVLTTDGFRTAILDVPSVELEKLKIIDTETSDQSYLLMKVRGDKGIQGGRMPAGMPPLEDEEIQVIEEWIAFVIAARAAEAAEEEEGAAGAAAGAAAAGAASEDASPADEDASPGETEGKKKP